MRTPKGYALISTAAVRGLASADAVDVDVFLPAADGADAVLYCSRDNPAGAAAHNAQRLDFERLSAHGVAHLFVRAEDLVRCEQALEQRLREMLANPQLTSRDRAEIVHSAGSAVARQILSSALAGDSINRASALTDGIVEGVMNDPNIAGYVLQMASHERSTASHMQMVATLAVIFGAEIFGDDEETLGALALAGMLHDVGKLSVPAETLHKEGPLSEREVQLIQQHPIESVRLIGNDAQVSAQVRQVILQHHERLDGRGYPLGLSGCDILPLSRLLTIVDSFHAMIGPRSYRAALSVPDANRAMSYQAGKQFDADMLECWINLCERHHSGLRRSECQQEQPPEDPSVRHEHLPARRSRAGVRQRRPRYVCAGKTAVRCVYTGRLPEVTAAPDDFGAPVYDVSQGGMCIHSAHPMYRGEVVCVRVKTGAGHEWIRSMVTWCAVGAGGVYRVGLKFLSKLDEKDVREQTDVQPMGGFVTAEAPEETPESAPARAAERATSAPAAKATHQKREDALERLAAIACMRTVDAHAERTVLVLSTSSDVAVRLKALDVLVQIGSRSARSALAALLHDPNRQVRLRAIDAVSVCAVTEAVAPLRDMLEDPDEQIVLSAAGALGTLNDWSGLRFVGSVLDCDGPNLRLAVRAFGRITGHNFPANREGVASARRYWTARRKELLGKVRDLMPASC